MEQSNSDLCRSLDFREMYMGENCVAVYFCQHHRVAVLDALDTGLLRACREFATIAEHQDKISRSDRTGRYKAEEIGARIHNLRVRGFLVSPTEILSSLRAHGEITITPTIASLGIPTRNRPETLKATLEAYLIRDREFGRNTRIVVADDSSTEEFRQRVRKVASAVQKKLGGNIFYIGPQERTLFASELARSIGIPHSIAKFGFGQKESAVSMGSARNALLLENAGQMFISSDDDAGIHIVPPPPASTGLALSTRNGNDYELQLFRSRQEMLSQVSFLSFDLTSAHERLLGKRITDLIATETPSAWNLRGLHAKRHPRIEPESQVLLTAPGIVGDIGCDSPLIYLLLPKTFWREWQQSETDYRMAVANRQILRRPRYNTIVDELHCMSTQMGFDNRTYLPPFPPFYRAEDTAFGEVMNSCVPNACVGFLSCCVLHSPPDERTMPKDFINKIGTPGINELLGALVAATTNSCSAGSVQNRIISLGNNLVELGKLPICDFIERIRELRCMNIAKMVASFEAQLSHNQSQFSYLAEDIATTIGRLKDLLLKQWVTPHDYLGDENDAPVRIQEYVVNYGALLQAWPSMLDWVRKEKPMERLARPIGEVLIN